MVGVPGGDRAEWEVGRGGRWELWGRAGLGSESPNRGCVESEEGPPLSVAGTATFANLTGITGPLS